MAMAMPSLIREVPGARLFLKGRGKKGPRLRDLCRELGLCNREDMHHVFQGVDAFIFASFNAGRGACRLAECYRMVPDRHGKRV